MVRMRFRVVLADPHGVTATLDRAGIREGNESSKGAWIFDTEPDILHEIQDACCFAQGSTLYWILESDPHWKRIIVLQGRIWQ
jgi:hypothetical protein